MIVSDRGPRAAPDYADLSQRDWSASAAAYEAAESAASRYARVAAAVVRMADLRAGMEVVDLACGTGTVVEQMLGHADGATLSIVGIDHSEQMLQIARARLPSSAIRFELARAEDLGRVVPAKVDRVLCNAAFWQMSMRRVLRAVRERLKPGGYFVVSSPDLPPSTGPSEFDQLYARSKVIWMLLEERAARGLPLVRSGGRPRVSQADIVLDHARDCGFRLVKSAALPAQSSAADALTFLKIPALLKASPLLAGLPPAERDGILDVVTAQLPFVDATVSAKLWRVLVLAPEE
jgi:ubiquinone/menaquinone biosynthesis C-methylase UbiE